MLRWTPGIVVVKWVFLNIGEPQQSLPYVYTRSALRDYQVARRWTGQTGPRILSVSLAAFVSGVSVDKN